VLAILHAEFETTLRLLGVRQARRLDASSLCEDHRDRLRTL